MEEKKNDACCCDGGHAHDKGAICCGAENEPKHGRGHGHDDGCGCGHGHKHSPSEEKNCDDDGCGCGHGHKHSPSEGKSCDDDGCGCGHDHGAPIEKDEIKQKIFFIGAAILLLIGARFLPFWPALAVYILAYLLVGHKVVLAALKNISHGKIFDENFLMAVASIGAFAIGDYSEAVAVMIFYNVGETLQDLAVAKSRKNITELMDIRPEFARVLREGAEMELDPNELRVGERILIKPGERVPLDCVVLSGSGSVDASALTGESVPISAVASTPLKSGSMNLSGVLTCEVTSVFAESTVQKILSLVSESSGKKAKAEKFITKFAKIYTPVVMGLALLLVVVPPLFLGFSTFSTWLYRGLVFLVVSCPCALVLSIPVSYLGGIGGAAKSGILVKGGDVLDALTAPKTIVFDKTGTLTAGKFAVQSMSAASGVDDAILLHAAAVAERSSNHPIALSVRSYCGEKDGGDVLTNYEEKAGFGVLASTVGGVFAAGNAKMMDFVGATVTNDTNDVGTVLHIAQNSRYLGTLVIADSIKPTTKSAIAALHELGVEKTFMLTGDNEAIAQSVASAVGLDGYKAGLLPDEKVAAYEALTQNDAGVSMYAGDGINDAPLLARADVGIAMGGVGSDAAIEAADLVLMTDDVAKIGTAIRIARYTRTIVKQNIIFSLGVKAIVLVLAALGFAPMWLAIFADVGVALIAVANATRAIRAH